MKIRIEIYETRTEEILKTFEVVTDNPTRAMAMYADEEQALCDKGHETAMRWVEPIPTPPPSARSLPRKKQPAPERTGKRAVGRAA